MNIKGSTPGQLEGIFAYRGLQTLNGCTPRTAQPAIEATPLVGKHVSNKHDLGTESVHAVFADKH